MDSAGGAVVEGDRTQTLTDAARRSGPTDKSYDLAGQAMKTRLARRMFGAGEAPPRIGRFRIERRIGSGGMGVVYEARDEELDRPVAIKLLHPDLDERHRVRMRREAQALAKLSHPNVVHAYEIGDHEGSLYLAMEFIDGVPLSKWERVDRSDWRRVVDMYIQAGRGLAAAHAAGIVHRDFKPSNVVVASDGTPHVLDFGLARGVDTVVKGEADGTMPNEVSTLASRVTITGTTLGTPAYMSPEQMLGQPTNAASDQYSFCIALYEALYGQRPFKGDRPVEMYEELLFGRIREAPEGTNVPGWLRAALLRGLTVRPEERHESMDALLEALEGPAPSRWWRAALAVAAVAVIATTWAVASADTRCQDTTPLAWDDDVQAQIADAFANSGATHAEAAGEYVGERLSVFGAAWAAQLEASCEVADAASRRRAISCLDERRQSFGALTELLSGGERSVVEHAFQLVDELPAVADCSGTSTAPAGDAPARVELMSARLDALAGKPAAARDRATAVLGTARADDNAAVTANALLTLAMVEREDGRTKQAVPLLREAASAALHADTPIAAVDAWLGAAEIEAQIGQLAASKEHSENARALLHGNAAPGDREARLRWVEGAQAMAAGVPEDAQRLVEEAIEGLEAARDPQHHSIAAALVLLGHAKSAQGNHDGAIEAYDASRTMLVARAGPDYPRLWVNEYSIGHMQLELGNAAGAIERLERALGLVADGGDRYVDSRAQIQVLLARAYYEGRFEDKAIEAARAGKTIYASTAGPQAQPRRAADAMLGFLLVRRGQFDEAAEVWRELAAGHAAAGDRGAAAQTWARLVAVDLRRGRPDDAAAVLARHHEEIAEPFAEQVLGLDAAVLGLQAGDDGRVAEARAAFERARSHLSADDAAGRWCDLWSWVSFQLAKRSAPEAAAELAGAAREHLQGTEHDPTLLRDIDAWLGQRDDG